VALAGAGSILAGLIQAAAGQPTTITRVLTTIFPTVITLWLVEMNILVLHKAPALERAITPARRR
jgi:Trk-type K+ transport system membrane component